MRQGQQNRRGRGRHNNNGGGHQNRKSQNPLTRSFESAGPDVKLRGTPSHLAEKYVSLARDALSSGDPVLAENYLQHAEHYNRIMLTFREQQMSAGGNDPFQSGQVRTHGLNSQDSNDGEDFGDEDGGPQPLMTEDGANSGMPGAQQPAMQMMQGGEQPPQQHNNNQRYDNRPPRSDNQRNDNNRDNRNFNNRNDRGGDRDGYRNNRNDNYRGDRNQDRGYDRGDRQQRFNNDGGEPREFRDDRNTGGDNGQNNQGGYRRRDRFQGNGQNGYGNRYENGNGNGQPVDGAVGNGFPGSVPPQPVARAEAPPPPPPPVELAPELEQPAFLRRPVRRPRKEAAAPDSEVKAPRPSTEDAE